jgi:hypothetical protein
MIQLGSIFAVMWPPAKILSVIAGLPSSPEAQRLLQTGWRPFPRWSRDSSSQVQKSVSRQLRGDCAGLVVGGISC